MDYKKPACAQLALTGEAQVRCLTRPRWRLEMYHRVFRMVAAWAFEGAHIIARRMGLNACKHHHRSALEA
jgi:hypothetical protein